MSAWLDPVITHAARQINNAQIHRFPFPHLFVENLFPDKFYAELMKHFPTAAVCELADHGHETSAANLLGAEHRHLLSEIEIELWTCAEAAHREINKQATYKFDRQISKRMTELMSIGYLRENALTDADFECQFYSRREVFEIGPHLHRMAELINVLHYLPSSDSHRHQGTQLYAVAKPTRVTISDGYPSVSAETLELSVTIPYLPNTAAIWPNTFSAIHGAQHGVGREGGGGTERRYLFSFSTIPEDKRNDVSILNNPLSITIPPQFSRLPKPIRRLARHLVAPAHVRHQ